MFFCVLCFSNRFCEYCKIFFFFFFNDTATTEIYTLSLHDALPISVLFLSTNQVFDGTVPNVPPDAPGSLRSEEHTSELHSHLNLVCRLLLEKKNLVTLPEAPLTTQRQFTAQARGRTAAGAGVVLPESAAAVEDPQSDGDHTDLPALPPRRSPDLCTRLV